MTRESTQSDPERLAWLRLYRSENVGPATFRNLIQRFGNASKALSALPELIARSKNKRPIKISSLDAAQQEVEMLGSMGGKLLLSQDPEYPASLRAIPDAPPVLSVIGHTSLLSKPIVGLVGSRRASLNAVKLASTFASELGQRDFAVASGLARGIDTAAHKGSLKTGTIAVIAGGIDSVYPKENAPLQQMIREQGLLIAEAPMGAEPVARAFPFRNRIIAGLSLGTVVVEAAYRSGTLITARLANEYGRQVFAVPGYPGDPRSQGCNKLIRDGAELVETAEQIAEALSPAVGGGFEAGYDAQFTEAASQEIDEGILSKARDYLLAELSGQPMSVDELVRQCHVSRPESPNGSTTGSNAIPQQVVLAALSELELFGEISRLPGNQVARNY